MSDFLTQEPLILASRSEIRQRLLSSLGLNFQVIPSEIDESKIKQSFSGNDIQQLGLKLAKAKACSVSRAYRDAFVIGADQLCVFEDQILDKPGDHSKAFEQLTLLQGKQHQQIACVLIAKAGIVVWQNHQIASLTMRPLSKQTIEAYLRQEQPFHSCGGYQFESQGQWLFQSVTGDTNTILGLPLLALSQAMVSLNIVRF